MPAKTLKLNAADSVLIALTDLAQGDEVEDNGHVLILKDKIPRGHKIACVPIPAGTLVRRYGQVIGMAAHAIDAGAHVHVHNLSMAALAPDYAFGADAQACANANAPIVVPRHFMGFRRARGRAGTRNYLGVLTTVNCSGSVARFIAEQAEKSAWFQACEGIDGIVPITHSSGCGMAGDNEGYHTLMRTLKGYAQQPNFAGVLLVGLGCEVMQVGALCGERREFEHGRFRSLIIQQTGGTRKTVEAGVAVLREMAQDLGRQAREPVSVADIMVGLQCGGSDSYSGITANPALGVASDLLVRHGGTTILSETSEIYGAEHLLTRRALSRAIGEKLTDRVRWWEDYCARNKGELNNNPSPGNKRGGLTTILEKSLGAVAKGGSAPLTDVYLFGEPITKHGFVFMDSPGYDPCSVTGQVASGANLIAFTTGRGSVSGYKPVPCIKIATNSDMYRHMADDMDCNAGDILEAGVPLAQKGEELFELFIAIASGEKTKSEALGFGGVEFVPWQIGAVM